MPEWRPGILEGLLRDIEATGQAHLREGLYLIAAAIEAQAKAALGKASHPYDTPTPAVRGGPPAMVTGTGRRSIGHQYLREGVDTEMRVGTHANVYPPRRGHEKKVTASSKYLWYQETLDRFNHPFLRPAFNQVVDRDGVRVWLAAFQIWPRI